MAIEKLEIQILAQDKTKGVFKNLGGQLGKLGKVAAVGAIAGLGALGVGVGALGVKLVGLGADAEEMQGKFDAVFKDLSGDVAQRLADLGGEIGRNRFALMEYASTLQDTFVPLGFARDAAADLSVEVVALAEDLASFNNLRTDDVVRDLQSALVGNTETLRKYGVVANETAIKAYAMEQGLWDGKGAMDAQTKAAAILGITLAGTTDAQGDALRTAGSFTNQMRALKSRIAETATEIGLKMLPALTPLLTKLGDLAAVILPVVANIFQNRILPVLEIFSDVIQDILNQDFEDPIGAFANVVYRLAQAFGFSENASKGIFDAIIGLREPFESLLQTVRTFVNEQVIPFITQHAEEFKGALIAIGAVLAGAAIVSGILAIVGAIGSIATGIGPIIALVALLGAAWAGNWLGIRDTLTQAWQETIKPALEELWQWLSVNIPIAIENMRLFWTDVLLPAVQQFTDWANETLLPLFRELGVWLQTNIPVALEALRAFWITVLLPAIQAVANWLVDTLFPAFAVLLSWLGTHLTAALTTLATFWQTILLPALTIVWDFIKTNLFPLFQAVGEFLGVAFRLILTALAGLWQNVILPALTKVWDFIKAKLEPIFQKVGMTLRDTLGPILSSIGEKVLPALSGAFAAVGKAVQGVISFITSLTQKLRNLSLPDWLTPGSPTPWELGLIGINQQLAQMSNIRVPRLSTNLSRLASAGSPINTIGRQAPGGGAINRSRTNNFNLTIHSQARTEPIIRDYEWMRAMADSLS